jgi:hypothetical protein
VLHKDLDTDGALSSQGLVTVKKQRTRRFHVGCTCFRGCCTDDPHLVPSITALCALILMRLIALFTNLFYFGRLSNVPNSPANHHLGWLALFVPVLGGSLLD